MDFRGLLFGKHRNDGLQSRNGDHGNIRKQVILLNRHTYSLQNLNDIPIEDDIIYDRNSLVKCFAYKQKPEPLLFLLSSSGSYQGYNGSEEVFVYLI